MKPLQTEPPNLLQGTANVQGTNYLLVLPLHLESLATSGVIACPDACGINVLGLTHLMWDSYFSDDFFLFGLKSLRPWDPLNDIAQYEKDGILQTMERHLSTRMSNHKATCINNQITRHKVKSLLWGI